MKGVGDVPPVWQLWRIPHDGPPFPSRVGPWPAFRILPYRPGVATCSAEMTVSTARSYRIIHSIVNP